MGVENLNSGNFDGFVNGGIVVVDFSAEWCGPCKIMGPVFKEASSEIEDVKFGKVDIEKDGELAQKFQVMNVPTLIFFKEGEQVDRTVGVLEKKELVKKLKIISK